MVFTRSVGGIALPATAMVTNSRSSVLVGAVGTPVVGSGGSSDGHRYERSTRSCAPGRRCTGTRIAAGDTLKATPAIVIGSGGASCATGGPGQRGQST